MYKYDEIKYKVLTTYIGEFVTHTSNEITFVAAIPCYCDTATYLHGGSGGVQAMPETFTIDQSEPTVVFNKITMTESCCTFTSYTMIDTDTGLAPDPTELELVLDSPSST